MPLSAKETKREKRIKKRIERNYSLALKLLKDIGADKFAEYVEDKNYDLERESMIYKLFPSIHEKKLEKELKLSKI